MRDRVQFAGGRRPRRRILEARNDLPANQAMYRRPHLAISLLGSKLY